MRNRGWIALMLVAMLAVACSDQKAPTGPDEVAAVPEFNFSNGPDVPGSGVVERWTDDDANEVWAFWVRDWNTDLMADVSTDPYGFCRDQDASDRSAAIQRAGFNFVLHGSDWHAKVYDATGWNGSGGNAGFCAWIDGKSPLAWGSVDMRVHFGQHETWKAQGQLDTDGPGQAHLRWMAGLQYDPHPPYDFIGWSNLIVKLNNDPRD